MTTVLDLVGPKGYEHGFIYVGTDSRHAAGYHGMQVVGITHRGNQVTGRYDHTKRQVVTPEGYRRNVTDVASYKQGTGQSQAPLRQALLSNMLDLVGPKGWEHNWHAVRPPATLYAAAHHGGGGSKLPTGKASETTAGRRTLLKAGHALPPSRPGGAPGYPIGDADHWDKAFRSVGRSGGGARRAALRKLLIKTAPEFGRSGKIKGSWLAASGGSKNMSNELALAGYGAQSATGEGMGGVGYGTGDSGYGDRPSQSGRQLRCPNCGYKSDDADFQLSDGSGGTSDPSAPGALATPDPDRGLGSPVAGAGFNAGQIAVRGASSGSYGSLSNTGRRTIDLSRKLPVASASDIIVSRGDRGQAVIRHRRGGDTIGEMARNEAGQWAATLTGGKVLTPHTHQRAALLDLITSYNTGTGTLYHRPQESLIPRPAQTPLMQRFGIPAATVLANPMNGMSDGPRATGSSASDGDGDDTAGLTPKGRTIYKKLLARKFPAARALAFARRAQNFGGTK